MTRYKNRFVTLKKEKYGSATFGNHNLAKIIGKGIVSLGNKDVVENNVLLIENMKRNFLSVSQMSDQRNTLIFDSKECEISKEGSDKIVATITKSLNNIYTLNEEEICYLGKEDEIWFWHKRMGHIHFDNLFKIIKKQVVR